MIQRTKDWQETLHGIAPEKRLDWVLGTFRTYASSHRLDAEQIGLIFEAGIMACHVLRPELVADPSVGDAG